MLHLHLIKSQASPYWDSLVRVYHTSFPIDEQRPIESIAHLIEHDERFVAYAIIDEDENYDECHFEHSEKSRKVRAELNGIATKVSCAGSLTSAPSGVDLKVRYAQDDTQSAYENENLPPKDETQLSTFISQLSTQHHPLGLLTTWHFEEFIYIEHFAIAPTLRSQGYGAEALRTFIYEHGKPIILEAEPPTDALSIRRIGFYERSGLTLYDFPYIQPAYTPDSNPVELCLMGTLDTNATPLTLVSRTLHREVYGVDL